MNLPLDTTGTHIVQMIPAANGITAVFDTPSFGAQAAPFIERMPLVCWVLVDDGREQAIEGVVVNDTGQLTFAKNCKGFLGYGYPGDDNRWSQKIHWLEIGNAYRRQKQDEPTMS